MRLGAKDTLKGEPWPMIAKAVVAKQREQTSDVLEAGKPAYPKE